MGNACIRRAVLAGAALLMGLGSAAAQAPASPAAAATGEWMVEKGYAIIRIVDCSEQMWGVVTWEKTPGIDDKNPDPAKRGRPTLGMPILLGMTPSGDNRWSGEIYNSQDGHTYSANISLADPDTLQVQGCVLGFLCGGEKWRRVTPDTTTGAAPGPASPAPRPGGNRNTSSSAMARTKTARTPPPAPQPPSAEEICLGLVGPAGGAHQGGLK